MHCLFVEISGFSCQGKNFILPNASFKLTLFRDRESLQESVRILRNRPFAHVNKKLKPFRAVTENTLKSAHKYIWNCPL